MGYLNLYGTVCCYCVTLRHNASLTLATVAYLARHSVWFADLVAPVATPDGNDRQLGKDNGAPDSSRHLLRALHAQTNMAVVVANSNKRLKEDNYTIRNDSLFLSIICYCKISIDTH